MVTIDFKHFGVFTDITQTKKVNVDIRKTLADILYKEYDGIVAHNLAFRIYRSDEAIALNEEEKGLLNLVGERGTGVFRDSLAIAMTEPEEM